VKLFRSYIVLGLILGMLFLSAASRGQDPAFSQFYANPLFMNPAMAGAEGPVKIYAGFRNQWPRANSPYVTYHASFDQYLESLQGGIGVHIINDRMGGGIFNTLSVDAIYARHLKVSRELTVTGGFQVSAGQRNMNPDGLVLPDELAGVPAVTLTGYSKIFPDFAVGFGGFYRNIFGGVAVHHLLQPYTSPSEDPNTQLNRKYTAHLGMLFPVFERRMGRELLQLSPNIIFIQQDIYQQVNYGMEVWFRNLLGGVWLRQDLLFSYGTLILSAGYGNEHYRFRYSYDARFSAPDLHIPSMGAHEISMVIIFENQSKSKKPRAIKTPKI
jgi:type IX secretion system PorP/SprF family membrane protein